MVHPFELLCFFSLLESAYHYRGPTYIDTKGHSKMCDACACLWVCAVGTVQGLQVVHHFGVSMSSLEVSIRKLPCGLRIYHKFSPLHTCIAARLLLWCSESLTRPLQWRRPCVKYVTRSWTKLSVTAKERLFGSILSIPAFSSSLPTILGSNATMLIGRTASPWARPSQTEPHTPKKLFGISKPNSGLNVSLRSQNS